MAAPPKFTPPAYTGHMWRRLVARTLFWPTFSWNVLLGRVLKVRHWWDQVDEHVILGAMPLKCDVPKLAAAGVKAVVNTCQEYAGPLEEYHAAGIEQLHMPTTDFTHPSLADVQRAVEFMNRFTERGETVYVHCKAGRARSATVVLCWLVAHRGMTAEAGQRLLLSKRPHVNARLVQRPVVQEFAARLSTAPQDSAVRP